ncbi:MAG TPA: hypothetical protein PKB15_00045 [Acidimicrobiia bacterium]|nr:hypothetical protein [Acidimicrobiia bacterium]
MTVTSSGTQNKDSAQIFHGNEKRSWRSLKLLAWVLVVALLVGGGVYVKRLTDENKNFKKVIASSAPKKVNKIVDKVGKLMELPKGNPSLLIVEDKKVLKEQPFFSKSENGDVVLIYTEAKQAILYRESNNKIINAASLIIENTTTTTAPAATTTKTKNE